jgi:hypothetical protein
MRVRLILHCNGIEVLTDESQRDIGATSNVIKSNWRHTTIIAQRVFLPSHRVNHLKILVSHVVVEV